MPTDLWLPVSKATADIQRKKCVSVSFLNSQNLAAKPTFMVVLKRQKQKTKNKKREQYRNILEAEAVVNLDHTVKSYLKITTKSDRRGKLHPFLDWLRI